MPTMLRSISHLFSLACYFMIVISGNNSLGKSLNPNTVVCYGPRGHRGHRGPVGDRGPVGEPGAPGRNGTIVTDPGYLNMIELWSTEQFSSGDVFFTQGRMTAGFSVQDPISAITVGKSGLYMIYYYILDSESYLETYVDGNLQNVIDASQFDNDQIWYQYPLYINAGQVVSFKSPYMSMPFIDPSFPESASAVLYSVSLQLIIP